MISSLPRSARAPWTRRPDLGALVVALGAVILTAGLAVERSHLSKGSVGALVGALAIAWAVRTPWGSAATLAPALLVPNLPARFGMDPRLEMGLLTFALVVAFWSSGAQRPPLSLWALLSTAVIAFALILESYLHGTDSDLQRACAIGLALASGVVLASTLVADARAVVALGVLGIPIALLAVGEALGMHNFWLDAVHATGFDDLAAGKGNARSLSTLAHPLIAGATLSTLALLIVSRLRQWWALAIGAILIAGSVATVSRSSLVALAAAAIVLVLQSGAAFRRTILQILVIVATAAVLITQVPELRHSFEGRALGGTEEAQTVRGYAITQLKDDWADDPAGLLFGQGVSASTRKLQAIGGISGFVIFDNQYVTLIYDVGIVPMALVILLGALAIAAASPEGRRLGLPMLVAVLVLLAFVDGLYWSSFGVIAGLAFGIAGSHPGAARHRRDQASDGSAQSSDGPWPAEPADAADARAPLAVGER